MTPEPNTKPTPITVTRYLELIKAMKLDGLGFEDISVRLAQDHGIVIPKSHVRPFVIGRDK